MSVSIKEKLDRIALDASLVDASDNKELEAIYTSLAELDRKVDPDGLPDIELMISNVRAEIDSMPSDALDGKSRLVGFLVDQLQHAVNKKIRGEKDNLTLQVFMDNLNTFLGKGPNLSAVTERLLSDPDAVNDFIQNTKNVLDGIESDLLSLEQGKEGPDGVNRVFRAFHTLKSEANLLGLVNAGGLAHKVEDLLAAVRSGVLKVTPDLVSLLLEIVDAMKEYLSVLSKEPSAALYLKYETIVDRLASFFVEPVELVVKSVVAEVGSQPSADQEKTMSDPQNDQQGQKKEKESEAFLAQPPELDLSDGPDILIEFIAEAREHLINSEESVLLLETNPEDMNAVDRIFRAFHTIKGVTSFLNLQDIRILAHISETMLDLVRKGVLSFNAEVTDTTLNSVDNLRTLLTLLEEQVSNNGVLKSPYVDVSEQIKRLQAIIQGQTAPQPKKVKPIGEIMIEEGDLTPDELKEALQVQQQASDEDKKRVGEILQDMNAVSKKDVNNALNIQAGKGDNSIKISVEKLDTLIDLVGELVISETQVIQNSSLKAIDDDRLVKDLSELDRITRSLQESAMSMRLVQIKPTFQKMVRIIRDLSKKSGKVIDVQLNGEDTEIDKNMVELVSDPLIHMVRNSADHGIEMPDVRKITGKDLKGTITLSAFHKAGNVVIQIVDDGAGLNKDKILAKAIEKGIISSEESLPEKRIWNLIFEPGFSTAEKVTDVSGRGVGMDVVRRNIEQLRGRIDISSEKGKGSCFSIYLPITLAIIEGIVLKVGRERYVMPISSVIEFVSPDERKKNDVVGQGEMYRFHDEVLPLVLFDKLFDVESNVASLEERTICVCESEYGRYCFVVDEVLGQQQVVIKSLGDRLRGLKGISGGAILGDGRVGLILDINGLVEYSKVLMSEKAIANVS